MRSRVRKYAVDLELVKTWLMDGTPATFVVDRAIPRSAKLVAAWTETDRRERRVMLLLEHDSFDEVEDPFRLETEPGPVFQTAREAEWKDALRKYADHTDDCASAVHKHIPDGWADANTVEMKHQIWLKGVEPTPCNPEGKPRSYCTGECDCGFAEWEERI